MKNFKHPSLNRLTRYFTPLLSASLLFFSSVVPYKKADAAIIFYANGDDKMAYAFLITGLVASAASGYGLILLTLNSSPLEQAEVIAKHISQKVPQLDRETSLEIAEKIIENYESGRNKPRLEKNQRSYRVGLSQSELTEILEKSQVQLNAAQYKQLQETVQ